MNSLVLLHERWRKDPVRAAVIALGLAVVALMLAALLDVFWWFGDAHDLPGYAHEVNWGPLYLTAFPIAVGLVGLLLQIIRDAIKSLDRVVKPVPGNPFSFSEALFRRFDQRWGAILLPVLAALTVLLVLGIDAGSIFAPYIGHLLPRQWRDWATMGAASHPSSPRMLYLLFNLYAFSLEAWLIYCGLLVLIGTAYPLLVLLNKGLREVPTARRGELPKSERQVDFARHYEIHWDYTDATGRCGLGSFDRVFGIFASIVLLTLGIAFVVAESDERNNHGVMTIGGAALAHGALLLLCVFFVGVLYPYWRQFPNDLPLKQHLPHQLRDVELAKPQAWPFGQMVIDVGVIGAILAVAKLLTTPIGRFWTG